MFDFLSVLIDTADFPPRWHCGNWTAAHGWTHVISDLAIWGAYTAIPVLIGIAAAKRPDWGFPKVLWLFVGFILACGTTHLIEATIFWYPIYRIGAVAKAATAVISWATVITLVWYGPRILQLPSITKANLELEREVLQRREVERKLVEQREVLQLALEAGGIGTWRYDIETNETRRDSGLNRIFGLPPDDTSTDSLRTRIHHEDLPIVDEAFENARHGDGEYRVEYRVRLPNKAISWVRDRAKLIRNEENEPVLITGAVVDITDLRRAEQGRARLAAIVESSTDAILTQSVDGIIMSWNAGAVRTFGYTAEEAIGQPISLIVPDEYAKGVEEYRAAVLRGEKLPNIETVRRCKDGRLIDLWLAVSPVFDRNGNVTAISAVERDITERNRHEERLEQLNQKLRARNKEMEQFAYIVSHDLKSPLVTMLGFVGLLREDLGDDIPEDVVDGLNRIEGAATRMSQLIDDLLELSRVGRVKGKSKLVDLTILVEQIRDALAEQTREAGANIAIVGELAPIRADRERLFQVLQNLITNALKYGCSEEDPTVQIGTEQHSDQTLIYVRDNGPGIKPEHHDRIFRLFERIEAGPKGTGVGLALVAKIMNAHGGRVWVESEPGHGATFWLAFPNRPKSSTKNRQSQGES